MCWKYSAGSADRDYKVLCQFYDATEGSSWTRNDDWKSNKPIGEWYGVETNSDNRVVNLLLPRNNVIGTLSQSISDIQAIQNSTVFSLNKFADNFIDVTTSYGL